MLCPVDNTELLLAERQGVEIDYCPQCRGVWLDRGELDKILERSASVVREPVRGGQPGFERDRSEDRRDHDDDRFNHRDREVVERGGRRRGAGGWLGDILGNFGGED